ncbi:hypothetical protein BCD66_12380 [Pseudoalteromonas tetraodonis]|nr:hypothetical protein BCD66_12380 [Pseudoalteromonas tetraodonis]
MLPGNVAISEIIEQRLQHKQPFSLAYIDLNHFKQFNDLYGYASGDSVIKLLADVTVKACAHSANFVGYIGGDDFMVVFEKKMRWRFVIPLSRNLNCSHAYFLRQSILLKKGIRQLIERAKSSLYLYLHYR